MSTYQTPPLCFRTRMQLEKLINGFCENATYEIISDETPDSEHMYIFKITGIEHQDIAKIDIVICLMNCNVESRLKKFAPSVTNALSLIDINTYINSNDFLNSSDKDQLEYASILANRGTDKKEEPMSSIFLALPQNLKEKIMNFEAYNFMVLHNALQPGGILNKTPINNVNMRLKA